MNTTKRIIYTLLTLWITFVVAFFFKLVEPTLPVALFGFPCGIIIVTIWKR